MLNAPVVCSASPTQLLTIRAALQPPARPIWQGDVVVHFAAGTRRPVASPPSTRQPLVGAGPSPPSRIPVEESVLFPRTPPLHEITHADNSKRKAALLLVSCSFILFDLSSNNRPQTLKAHQHVLTHRHWLDQTSLLLLSIPYLDFRADGQSFLSSFTVPDLPTGVLALSCTP